MCTAGALSAEVIELDGDAIAIEARYTFPDRETFERYQEKDGPRLREEGLALFPAELGIEYTRRVGTIALTLREK